MPTEDDLSKDALFTDPIEVGVEVEPKPMQYKVPAATSPLIGDFVNITEKETLVLRVSYTDIDDTLGDTTTL